MSENSAKVNLVTIFTESDPDTDTVSIHTLTHVHVMLDLTHIK